MDQDITKFLHGVQNLVRMHGEIGLDRYPRAEVEKFLGLRQPVKPPGSQLRQSAVCSPQQPANTTSPAVLSTRIAKPPQPPPNHLSTTTLIARPQNQDINLEEIRLDIGDCTACPLHKSRTNIVFGNGGVAEQTHSAPFKLMLIGDQPSSVDDQQGSAFAGEAGQLLDRMLAAINLRREEVYLTNLVKCRPPEDRLPARNEYEKCVGFLVRQIMVLSPAVICVMGSLAAQVLMNTRNHMFTLRGRFFDFYGHKLLVSFHPALLLQNEELKKGAWQDLQAIQRELYRKAQKSLF